MTDLVLYGRPGCHLCDRARAELTPVAEQLGLDWREVNIEDDDELHRRFLVRIPVLADGDAILAELDWHLPELRAKLESLATRG